MTCPTMESHDEEAMFRPNILQTIVDYSIFMVKQNLPFVACKKLNEITCMCTNCTCKVIIVNWLM